MYKRLLTLTMYMAIIDFRFKLKITFLVFSQMRLTILECLRDNSVRVFFHEILCDSFQEKYIKFYIKDPDSKYFPTFVRAT